MAIIISNSNLLLDPSARQHVALLYENTQELNEAIAVYINEGLRRGQLCVYATVHYRDEGHIEHFLTLIEDGKENVEKGNLLIIDLALLYIASIVGDLTPFDDAKRLFVENVRNRADRHIRFVGDGTGFLFKNKHFDECAMVEEWWQNKPFEGSYFCPFQKQYFNAYPDSLPLKRAVISTHDVVVNASELNRRKDNTDHDGHHQALASAIIKEQSDIKENPVDKFDHGGETN